MQTDQTTRALLSVPLFSGLPPSVVEAIAAKVRRRRFRPGEVIFHEGDPGRSLCILESGRVKIMSVSEQGQEVLHAVMSAGEFFGEMALFDEMPRSADVVAMDATQTLNLSDDDLFAIVERFPFVAKYILAVLAKHIRRLTTEVSDIVFLNLDARIAKRLLDLADNMGTDAAEGRMISLSQAELGSMVGATRESVNQCLQRFQDAGLLIIGRQRITVVKPDGLRRRINY